MTPTHQRLRFFYFMLVLLFVILVGYALISTPLIIVLSAILCSSVVIIGSYELLTRIEPVHHLYFKKDVMIFITSVVYMVILTLLKAREGMGTYTDMWITVAGTTYALFFIWYIPWRMRS